MTAMLSGGGTGTILNFSLAIAFDCNPKRLTFPAFKGVALTAYLESGVPPTGLVCWDFRSSDSDICASTSVSGMVQKVGWYPISRIRFRIFNSSSGLVITLSEIRLVPELITEVWNDDTLGIIQDLGFTYELRNQNNEIVTSDDAQGLPITGQTPEAGTFANATNTVLGLTITT